MKRYIKASESIYIVDVIDVNIDVVIPTKSEYLKATSDFSSLTEDTINPIEKKAYLEIVQDVKTDIQNEGYIIRSDKPSSNADSLSYYFRCVKLYPNIQHAVVLNIRVSNHIVFYNSVREEIEKIARGQEQLIRLGKRDVKALLNIPDNKSVSFGVTDEINFIVNGISPTDKYDLMSDLKELLDDLNTNYTSNDKFITLRQVKEEKHRRLAGLKDETDT